MSEADQSQRTHKPTPKRIKEFRKRGEIALSKDVISTASLLCGLMVGGMFATQSASGVANLTRASMMTADGGEHSGLLEVAISAFSHAVWPVTFGALAGLIVAGCTQLGWPPAFKGIKFNLAPIFTLQGAMKVLSPKQAAGRVAKATAKVVLVGGAMVLAILSEYESFMAAPALNAEALIGQMGSGVMRVCAYSVGALAGLAAIDYAFQRFQLMKKMKMTSDELKREMKQQDGDPMIRSKRKQRMRELARRRLEVEVKTADVILVNPTEYAVALRYSANKERAPRVVAKGKDIIAAQIRAIARKAGIPIVRRPPLTRLIHKLVPEGREIPAELYQVVAEILAYVYRLRGATAGGAR